MPTPASDFVIDRGLVAALLHEQHPDLSHLPLGERFEGWDNVSIRLGEELLVRLPRRSLSIALSRHEHRILPNVAPGLEIAVPVPVRIGEPSPTFEAPWSVVPWIPGHPAPTTGSLGAEQAVRLGVALRRVHAVHPGDLPCSPHRGHPLSTRLEAVSKQLRRAHANGALSDVELTRALEAWSLFAAVRVDEPSVLIHGDLHPNNIVVRDGVVVALIDWGDVTPGDRAADLSIGWSLFDPVERRELWRAYRNVGPSTLDRARGWALRLAALWLTEASDIEGALIAGQRTIRRVLADRRTDGPGSAFR